MAAKSLAAGAWKRWTCGYATIASVRHRSRKQAGQDAAYARLDARPIVIVADGRGSSAHSEIGATAAADHLPQLVDRHESLLAQCLDSVGEVAAVRKERWESTARILLGELVEKQKELAGTHGVDARELEFTLAVAIVGKKYVGVLQVGDSCVAIARRRGLQLALPPDQGNFAGETNFVGPDGVGISQMASLIFPTRGVTGLVAFTDGLAPRWIEARTLAIAPGVGQMLNLLGDRAWDQSRLEAFLARPIWDDVDDDRGVAYMAKGTFRPSSGGAQSTARSTD